MSNLSRSFWAALLVTTWAVCAPSDAGAGAFPGENGRIAFTVVHGGGTTLDVASMAPTGEAQFQLTHDGVSAHPAWSPDGTRIAFASGNDVYTMDEYGNDRQLVLDWDGQVGEIDWSPDGTRLVASLGNCAEFDCSPDIYVFALDGSGLTNVTEAPWDDEHPSWSPGGTKIAFDSIRAGQQDIYTVMPDGTGLTKVMPGADPDWKPDNSQLTAGRTWSPDGLAYATAAPAVGAYSAAGQELGHSTLGPGDFRHFEPDWQPRASYPDPPFVPEGDYARPKGATPLRVSLVNAFDPCAPEVRPVNNTHGAPLSYPSCTRPHWASDYVINGTPDANNFPAEAVGFVRFDVQTGNPTTPADEADVQIRLSQSDVRDIDAPLRPDYTGELLLSVELRITDTYNTDGAGSSGTAMDFSLGAPVPCVDNGNPNDGALCTLATSADALTPNTVRERRRSIWQLGQVRLYDGGPDSVGSTPLGNTLFATQGVFVP